MDDRKHGRMKKLEVSQVNVVIHPHSPDLYVDLFYAALRARQVVRLRKPYHGMIGELWPLDRDDPASGLAGKLYRFVQIDPKAPWFNLEKHEEATDEEMAQVRIPENMKPDMARFSFVFYPKGHKLYFEADNGKENIGPDAVSRLLESVFSAQAIVDKFGPVDVTVIPEREQLGKILSINRLSSLVIDIKRPNSDGLEDAERRVMDRLNRQNARSQKIVLSAVPGTGLEPDDEMKTLARVASNNGKVTGSGHDLRGSPVKLSTADLPWRTSLEYDPENFMPQDALVAETRQLDHEG